MLTNAFSFLLSPMIYGFLPSIIAVAFVCAFADVLRGL